MTVFPNPKKAREAAKQIRQELPVPQQGFVEKIERKAMMFYSVSEGRFYGVLGCSPADSLRAVVALFLERHPDLRLPREWVARYLNTTPEALEQYEAKFDELIDEAASKPMSEVGRLFRHFNMPSDVIEKMRAA